MCMRPKAKSPHKALPARIACYYHHLDKYNRPSKIDQSLTLISRFTLTLCGGIYTFALSRLFLLVMAERARQMRPRQRV